MTPRLSVQLYSLREAAANGNHPRIIAALGAAGFHGVETAGLYGMTPAAFRSLCADHGLVISSTHGPLPTKENLQEILDTNLALGCRYAISGFWQDQYTETHLAQMADQCRWASEALAPYGLVFALHNHWQEFSRLGGLICYDWMIDRFPGLTLEIDTYWACNFGAERPAEMVNRYRDRTPLLHLKDGNFVRDQPMVACGKGQQDFPAILRAADPRRLEWAVVELDACATDMLQAVVDSGTYLAGTGLVGRRPLAAKG